MSKKQLFKVLTSLMEGNKEQAIKEFTVCSEIKGQKVLNELSKKTLGSYIKKAVNDVDDVTGYNNLYNVSKKKVSKRKKGIDKAVSKLVKEGKEPETYTAPSAWISYLMNDDSSGLDDDDIKAADEFIEWVGAGMPVNAEDAGFIKHHDAYQFCPYAADCQKYTFLTDREHYNDDRYEQVDPTGE